MFAIINNIPFIGKHKRLIGGGLMAASWVLPMFGQDALGAQLRDWGNGILGLGLLHGGLKSLQNDD